MELKSCLYIVINGRCVVKTVEIAWAASAFAPIPSRASFCEFPASANCTETFNCCLKSRFCHIFIPVCLDLPLNFVDVSAGSPAWLDACLTITGFNLID